ITTTAGLMATNLVVASLGSLDPAFHPTNSLRLLAFSSDNSIVSPAGVFFTTLDGNVGAKRAVSVVPAGAGTGTATVTVQVDNGAVTNSATFDVTVLPIAQPLAANTNAITVAAGGNASSTITIPANTIAGLVGQATV